MCLAAISASQLRGWNPGSGCWLGPLQKGLSCSSGGHPPTSSSHPCVLARLWSLLPRVLIQARALSRGISSYLICICTLGDPHPHPNTHKTQGARSIWVNSKGLILQWEEKGSRLLPLTFSSNCDLCAFSVDTIRDVGAHGVHGTCQTGLDFPMMKII